MRFPDPPYYLWNHWYVAARSSSVPAGGTFRTTMLEQPVLLVRTRDGQLHAVQDRCLHLGASLALGKLEGDCLVCPFHGWRYQADGRLVDIPALGPTEGAPANLALRSYPVREGGGLVWVFMGRKPGAPTEEDPVPPELAEGGWQTSVLEDSWPVNYTRFVENMMDQVHVAWVHRGTIGKRSERRGPLTPEVEVQADGLVLQGGMLEFRFPASHCLRIAPHLRQRMYGTPVGPQKTRIYLMGLRRFMKSPWLDPIFNHFNRRILEEDRAVVTSQQPPHITYGAGGDLLLQPDSAAKAYRRLLAERLGATEA